MRIAIHQPNLCPWGVLLRKIEAVDLFVILGEVQFEKGGYQNRFMHPAVDGQWYTMAVRHAGLEAIKDKRYVDAAGDWDRIKRRLNPESASILSRFDDCVQGDNLLEINTAIIKRACALMGTKTPIVSDYPTDLAGTNRLVDICEHFGATEYLAGSGSLDYMDFSLFGEIVVRTQAIAPEDRKSMIEALGERLCASC